MPVKRKGMVFTIGDNHSEELERKAVKGFVPFSNSGIGSAHQIRWMEVSLSSDSNAWRNRVFRQPVVAEEIHAGMKRLPRRESPGQSSDDLVCPCCST